MSLKPCSVCVGPIQLSYGHEMCIFCLGNEQLASNPQHPPSDAPSELLRKKQWHPNVEHDDFSGELTAQCPHASHFSDPSSPPVVYAEAGAHAPLCTGDVVSFRAPGEEQDKAMSRVASNSVDWSASHVDGYPQQQH